MGAVEKLQAAIDKLEQLRGSSQNWRIPETDEDGPRVVHDFDTEGYGPGTGPLAWTSSEDNAENIVTLYRTIDAQLEILRSAIWDEQERAERRLFSWGSRELDLADAILGGA